MGFGFGAICIILDSIGKYYFLTMKQEAMTNGLPEKKAPFEIAPHAGLQVV